MGYIYKITNKINNKVYIGKTSKTVQTRWNQHIHDAEKITNEKRPLYEAFKKYGICNFTVEVIEECSDDMLIQKEIDYIAQYHSYIGDPQCCGYNATPGGDGKPYQFSEIEIESMLDLYHQGKTVLEIANIANHDSHTVAKELHKHNCSLKPGRQRPVYQLDIHTNEIIGWYESCSDAAIKCFNNRRHNGHINDVVNGKRKSAYGYKWCYVDEYLESELDAAV